MKKTKIKRKSRKKLTYHNPWHFHHANNMQAAKRIARQLQTAGKDIRIKPASNKKGLTVWERN